MGKPDSGDIGIDPFINAELSVALAPIAGICREHIRQSTSCGGDALQQLLRRSLRLLLQVLHIRRLVADAHRHDHLMVAVNG